MNQDSGQSLNFKETGEEAQDEIAEAGRHLEETELFNSTSELDADAGIGEADGDNVAMAAIEVDEAIENEAAAIKDVSEVEARAKKSRKAEGKTAEAAAEAGGPRGNESTMEWLERMEREARTAREKVKQTATALKSAREVEAEAKSQATHTRKRLKIANQQVKETLDAKYRAECAAEMVIERLQAHRIQAAKSAEEQAVKEARERARYEAEELKWKSRKAEQEAKFRSQWDAGIPSEPDEKKSTSSKSAGEVKAETRREAAQIRERLHGAILLAKREAQEALERAKREAEAASQEISQEAKERIGKLHVAILRAIANRNEIKIEADAADERAVKKAEALKSAREDHAQAKREAAEAMKRLRQAMSAAKNEAREARDRAKHKAREATMVASSNETSGFVRLQIARPVTYGPVREFELALTQSGSFRVESVGGTVDEGAYIDVFIDEPVHLLSMLSQMPLVESFWKNDKGVKVELNTAVMN